MSIQDEFLSIVEGVKICPHIGEFPRLANGGHPANRVVTCREDNRADEIPSMKPEDNVLSFFVPGWAIHLSPDGTWRADPDGDN